MNVAANLPGILLAGKVLSGITVLIFLGALVNLWRRESLPELSYGTVTLSHERLRWLWVLFLVGGFATGSNGDPIVWDSSSFEEPITEAEEENRSGDRLVQSEILLPLPFYRYERETTHFDGRMVKNFVLEGVVFPWELLSALAMYYFLVLRWDPENRWTRRILHGRRRRWGRRRSEGNQGGTDG